MKKIDRQCFTLIDTYEASTGWDGAYDDYKEFCEINGLTPDEDDSDDYWNWLNEENTRNIDDFFLNLEWSKIDYPLLITGTLGLWNGSPDIDPVLCESEDWATHYKNYKGEWKEYHKHHYEKPSIMNAIKKCISGRSIEDFKVRFNNGVIEVDAIHHDGTNTFYIQKLSKKGLNGVHSADNRGVEYEPKDYWFAKIKYDEIW